MSRSATWRRLTLTLPRIRVGNQEVWRRASKGLDIRYNEPVDRLSRQHSGFCVHRRNTESLFDSVIWTTSLPRLDAPLTANPETEASGTGSRHLYRKVRYLRRANPIYHVEGLPRDICWSFPEPALAGASGVPYGLVNWPGTDCFTFYFWLDESCTVEDVDRGVRDLIARLGGRAKSPVTEPVIVDYHPYFDSKALEENTYRKLESDQGRHGLYLCGEIMSGIMLPATSEYAKNLIERFF